MLITTKIHTDRLNLRVLTMDDAGEKYKKWLCDVEVNTFLETRNSSVEELQKYIKEKNESTDSLLLGIFWRETNEHIGNIKLEPINLDKKTAMIGLLIGEKDFWGKGIASEAIDAITTISFGQLGLEELTLGVISDHVRAIRAYEKSGFKQTDYKKEAISHDGIKFDQIIMKKKNTLK